MIPTEAVGKIRKLIADIREAGVIEQAEVPKACDPWIAALELALPVLERALHMPALDFEAERALSAIAEKLEGR